MTPSMNPLWHRICMATMVFATLTGCRKAPEPPPEFGPAVVTVARPLTKMLVDWDRFTGRFVAVEEVNIRARVSGYLQSVHFTEGSVVEAGSLLFIIDPAPFQAALDQATALVAEAKARVTQAEAGLAQSQAGMAEAQAQEALAASRLERAQQAVTTNAIAKEQVEARESELRQAAANLRAAEARVAQATAAIASAVAAVSTAEAAQHRAEIDLTFCRIESPVTGRVGRQLVTRGNLVDGGLSNSTSLTSIVSLDPIYCEFDASEQEFLRYSRLAASGQRESSREVANPAYAALTDEKGYPHQGHMDFVDNRLDQGTATIRGRAVFPNPDRILTPGLFATVRIPGSGRYQAMLIPDAAVGTDLSLRFVYVTKPDGSVERRPVEVGRRYGNLRIVRSGIQAEEWIVVEGMQRILPGAPVAPTQTTLTLIEDPDGLPNDYTPIPKEQWLSRVPAADPKGQPK